jgi:hypothetical protein
MRENVLPILEFWGVDLVLAWHSHSYERSYLLNGHYGTSDTLQAAMRLNSGDGRADGTGAYVKGSPSPASNEGAVYVVAGSSGWVTPDYGLNHPAMFIGLRELGSLVLDIDGNRMDAKFLRENGVVADYFTILKGEAAERPRLTYEFEPGLLTLRWNSVPGEFYRVEKTGDIAHPSWQSISGELQASDLWTEWSASLEAGPGKAFYRVVNCPD